MGVLSDLLDQGIAKVESFLSSSTPQRPPVPPAPRMGTANDGIFTLGQPATTGPLTVIAGTPLVTLDPNVYTSDASNRVQVQNSSGYLISVMTGGINYTIQPFTAATIPTSNRTGSVITVKQTVANYGKTLTLVWLIGSQQAPMSDGPLSVPPQTFHQLTISTATDNNWLISGVFPTDVTLNVAGLLSSVSPSYALSIVGTTTNHVYFTTAFSPGTFSMSGTINGAADSAYELVDTVVGPTTNYASDLQANASNY